MTPNSAPERIFLTGYMGVGKSTIGRLLARRLGYKFMDTDRLLVRQFGKPIRKVFAEEGEMVFRQAELDLLKELAHETQAVISAGGGTLTREDTFGVAYEAGPVVYLCAPVKILYERVIFSPKDRPMIDVPNPEESFRERFAQREPFYQRAHLTIDTENKEPARIVDDILTALETGGFCTHAPS